MATLIAVYGKDGKCQGRCDAKCYKAKQPSCDCICGGRNHGCGKKQAIENTRELFEEWIEAWKEKHPDLAREVIFEVPAYTTVTQLSFIPGLAFETLVAAGA